MDANGSNRYCVYGSGETCLINRQAGLDFLSAGSWDAASDWIVLAKMDSRISPSISRIRLLDLTSHTIQDLSGGSSALDAGPHWLPPLPADLWVRSPSFSPIRWIREDFRIVLEYGNSGEIAAQSVSLQLNLPDNLPFAEEQP